MSKKFDISTILHEIGVEGEQAERVMAIIQTAEQEKAGKELMERARQLFRRDLTLGELAEAIVSGGLGDLKLPDIVSLPGRPRVYDFASMKPGERFEVEGSKINAARSSLYQYQKKNPGKFIFLRAGEGYFCLRIS